MNPQAMTFEQIREQDLAVSANILGSSVWCGSFSKQKWGQAIIQKNGING